MNIACPFELDEDSEIENYCQIHEEDSAHLLRFLVFQHVPK